MGTEDDSNAANTVRGRWIYILYLGSYAQVTLNDQSSCLNNVAYTNCLLNEDDTELVTLCTSTDTP